MFNNDIVIHIEDLHTNTSYLTGQRTFANVKEAAAYAYKLNDYYAEKAIPKIARVAWVDEK